MKTRVLNADEAKVLDEYTDARHLCQKSQVIPSEKIGQFSVKQWPMLDDGSDSELTNALGYRFDYFRNKQLEQERELAKQKEQAEMEAIEEAQKLVDEELNQNTVTAAELDELRKAAEDEGRESGYKAGFDEGFAKGTEEGIAQGQKQGFDEGHQNGVDEGFKEGLARGFEEGRQKGLLDGEAIVTEQSEKFRHLADALAEPLRDLDAEVTYEVIRLTSELFKTLAGRELRGDKDFLVATVNKALAKLPVGTQGVTIKLNPDDLMLVETAMGRDYIKAQHWILQEDDTLKPGDVVISDGKSLINEKLDERIANLIEDFLDESAAAVDDAKKESILGSSSHEQIPSQATINPAQEAVNTESVTNETATASDSNEPAPQVNTVKDTEDIPNAANEPMS